MIAMLAPMTSPRSGFSPSTTLEEICSIHGCHKPTTKLSDSLASNSTEGQTSCVAAARCHADCVCQNFTFLNVKVKTPLRA